MDFLTPIVEKYQKQFKNPKDILEWIEHDLRHMGLGDESVKEDLNKARKILGVKL